MQTYPAVLKGKIGEFAIEIHLTPLAEAAKAPVPPDIRLRRGQAGRLDREVLAILSNTQAMKKHAVIARTGVAKASGHLVSSSLTFLERKGLAKKVKVDGAGGYWLRAA